MDAVLGAAAVVLQRGEDRTFGLLFRASRAILTRAAVRMKQSLVRFTTGELLLSLGEERAEHMAARFSSGRDRARDRLREPHT